MAPSTLGWKKFSFFQEEARSSVALPGNVTCSCSLGSSLWLGCSDGLVICLNQDLSIRSSFKAYASRVDGVALTSSGKLATVGHEAAPGGGVRGMALKLWAVEGLRGEGSPPCSLNLPLFGSGRAGEASLQETVVCVEDWPLVWVGVGLSTGAVHVLKCDTVKAKVTQPLPVLNLPRGTTPAEDDAMSAGGAITALHFVKASDDATSAPSAAWRDDRHLFVVTRAKTVAFEMRAGQKVMEEGRGAPVGCSAVRRGGTGGEEVLVAGPEAVYSFSGEEGKRAAYVIKGDKLAMGCAGRQLIVVLPDDSPGAGASSSAGARQGAEAPEAVVRVFDLHHKIVSGSARVELPVQWMQYNGGRVLVGDGSGGVVCLAELALSARLEALYKARAFQLALALAESEQADALNLAAVRRRYGDFLYSKRDYDQAMEQYISTIGQVEPSYVIQRFLDVQRITHLTHYLEQLHARGQASSDHTTLLLNCYTKSKQVEKLDQFIQQGEREGEGGGRLPFDVDTAIRVLRAAGYAEHALYVALVAQQQQTYLEILLEDCQRFEEGLEYVKGLPREQAAQALKTYGKALLGAVPVETTALLMGLCLPDTSSPPDPFMANIADFTQLYTDRPDDLQYACVTILAMCPDTPSAPTLYHTLLDLYLGAGDAAQQGQQQGDDGDASTSAAAGGTPANPRGASSAGRRDALDLLKRGWPPGGDPCYNVDQALVVCRMRGFREGLLLLYENLRLYREAAAVLMEAGDGEGLIGLCDRYGDPRTAGDPQLWHEALDYFGKQEGDHTEEIRQVVSRIEAGGLLPPLAVLQSLGGNPALRLELVKDYVTRQLQAEHRQIKGDQEESEQLREEIASTREQLQRLKTEPVVFQSSRDSQTGAPLELPSLHFLCGHSFNLRTLGGGDESQQCPLCAADHAKTASLRRSYKASAADKDSFFKQLRSAHDGFSLVAEYFGRGLLNNTSVSIHPNSS